MCMGRRRDLLRALLIQHITSAQLLKGEETTTHRPEGGWARALCELHLALVTGALLILISGECGAVCSDWRRRRRGAAAAGGGIAAEDVHAVRATARRTHHFSSCRGRVEIFCRDSDSEAPHAKKSKTNVRKRRVLQEQIWWGARRRRGKGVW